MLTKVEGIIISTTLYQETSLVINIFTKEYGIIGLMAKGVKSIKNPLHALTLKYTYGFFYIYYKKEKLSLLKDVDIIDPFKNIHQDLNLLSYMAYITDLSQQVYKESHEIKIYDMLINSLKQLNQKKDPQIIAQILEVKYLDYLGVGLYLDGCVSCGRKTNIVTIKEGGLICKNCYQNEPIYSLNMIKVIRIYYLLDLKKIPNLPIENDIKEEIDRFLNEYYSTYTGLYLKSKNFLSKLKDFTF